MHDKENTGRTVSVKATRSKSVKKNLKAADKKPKNILVPIPATVGPGTFFDRRSEQFQLFIRNKFIETAKKYIGIPYRQKYLDPSDANYNSPLFLDCCGLVRQVMRDLKHFFGFTIGKWNQSYQFDLLPRSVDVERLKPGDLIFYQGRFYEKGKRRKIHDMTHVEIYLGGEKTIGARFRLGTVQIFDSYKFESTNWSLTKHHFKSIDTWIEGVCRSFCQRHSWKTGLKAGPKPVNQNSDNHEDSPRSSLEINKLARVSTVPVKVRVRTQKN